MAQKRKNKKKNNKNKNQVAQKKRSWQ